MYICAALYTWRLGLRGCICPFRVTRAKLLKSEMHNVSTSAISSSSRQVYSVEEEGKERQSQLVRHIVASRMQAGDVLFAPHSNSCSISLSLSLSRLLDDCHPKLKPLLIYSTSFHYS